MELTPTMILNLALLIVPPVALVLVFRQWLARHIRWTVALTALCDVLLFWEMKYISDSYGERCRFDAFCKTVLRNEARTHLRDLGRQRNRETEFSALSQQEMDKLCTVDEYPSDSFLFTAYGYALHIRDELVADAFASLPEQEQGILILYCVLELADGEIGGLVGMSSGTAPRP